MVLLSNKLPLLTSSLADTNSPFAVAVGDTGTTSPLTIPAGATGVMVSVSDSQADALCEIAFSSTKGTGIVVSRGLNYFALLPGDIRTYYLNAENNDITAVNVMYTFG